MTINPTLDLPADEMRALGYRVVDEIVAHWAQLGEKPAASVLGRGALEALLREQVPEQGMAAGDALDLVFEQILRHTMFPAHPRFFAWVPGPGNYVSVLADMLASGFGVYPDLWIEASGPTMVELVAVDWLRALVGFPEGAGGLFTSGGSVANLIGLAVARHDRLGEDRAGARIYCSDQTHVSNLRALRILGFARDQVALLPHDPLAYSLRIDLLRAAVAADRAAGLRPFCVVANAGTTNTGAVDPLEALADFCALEGLWLHVDGAYGAAAVLCPQGARRLAGLERADSLAFDPHKWLFQPLEIGGILVRDAHLLRQTFQVLPEYLQDSAGEGDEVNLSDYGVQLTRGFRALKLWLSLKVFGLASFRAAVARGIELAEYAQRVVERTPGWQVVSPASLGIVTFRFGENAGQSEKSTALHRRIVAAVMEQGEMMVGSTILQGRTVLRMCTINPRTTEYDIDRTIASLDAIARRLSQ